MKKKQSSFIGFRITAYERTLLDHEAEKRQMTRTDLIRLALKEYLKTNEKIDKDSDKISRLFDAVVNMGNKFNELYAELFQKLESVENIATESASKNLNHLTNSVQTLAWSIVITNPKSKEELKSIFTNPKVWEEL